MTSYVSEALSGLSGEVGSSKNNNASSKTKSADAVQQQHHLEVMDQVLTKTRRIQREMRGRKTRELSTQIQGTIDALTELKEEPWPPKPPPAPPEWMGETGTTPREKQVLDGAMEFVSRSRSNTAENAPEAVDAEEATATTAADSTDGDTPAERNGSERNGAADPPGSLMVKGRLDVNPPVNDDPQIDEPMHPAIVVTLECYASVMSHAQKTAKACEMALDCVSLLLVNRYVSGRAGGRDGEVGQSEEDRSLLHALMESITACSDSSSESVQIGVVKALLALMTSPKCGIHEGSMLLAVRTVFHIYLVTKSPACKDLAKDTLLDMLRSVFNRMEAYDAMIHSEAHTPSGAATPQESPTKEKRTSLLERADPFSGDKAEAPAIPPSFTAFASQYHTDSYLLFRALCKLSSKNLPGDDEKNASASSMMSAWYGTQPADPLALNSKILSLELILAVLDHCGDAFCRGEKFIYAVQNYLCVSLLKNCMSNNTQVAYLSQKIFLKLVLKFKAHLKSEIEVFVANIFLRVLESPNSSLKQKALVLEALRSLCSDPVLLTQIFLNYDCDLDAANLYKDIVFNLTKLSGKATVAPAATASKKDAENDYELSLVGLEVLLSILRAFLKAMGCPVSEEENFENSASSRLRTMLQIDVGLAAAPKEPALVSESSNHGSNDDVSIGSEVKTPEIASPAPQVAKGSSAVVAGEIVNKFEAKRNAEQNFVLGTVKFTLSMKSGLKYFIDNGFLELDAREVALFFLANKDKLDKTQLGEALGREPDSGFLKDESIDAEKGGPGFYVRVLHHYVDALDFTGLEFDNAIRLFLSGFRLPGEAQKIDRIMEKFAERFTRQNLDVFPSADTAFILAFSVIMLQTDLHNPSIKPEKRMTVDSFIRNNRGISVDGGDLPEEFLRGIFERVKKQPFTLKEDDQAREKVNATQAMFDTAVFFEGPSFFGTSVEERKRQKFKEEREELMAASEKLFKRRPGKNAARAMQAASAQLTDSVAPIDVVKPMFDVTWGPLIGTLSQLLECSDDERTIAACLNGFVYAVRISAHSDMSLARDTFVNSLAKFTFLGSVKEMKHKNIESIRTLLSIAVIDGEYLGESWGPVLQCISQLGRLRLFASGLGSDEDFLVDQDAPPTEIVADGGGMFRQPTKAETEREMENSNSRAVLSALSEVLIDKVFTSTVNLSSRSIAHFIEQLVEVSAMEIAGDSKRGISGFGASSRKVGAESSTPKASSHNEDGPRIFSLQRLVEVADYNMNVRPRLAWAQVWEIMARHFAKIGCHENAMVSIFAIDSLKQLSFKFLEKPELSEFNFQRIFLRPFLQIMDNSKTRVEIREMILRCVDNMIRSMSHNLRSGWKIFFSILTLSASDQSEKISTLGLAILQRLLDEHLHQLCRLSDDEEIEAKERIESPTEISAIERRNRNANVEDFVGLCRASLSFVQTEESETLLPIGLSMRALCHIAIYADLLSEHRVLPPVSGAQSDDPHAPGYTYDGLSEHESLKMVLWRPLLDGLAEGISSTAPSNAGGVGCLVQRGSVMTLRAILLRHGHMFSASEWEVILKQTVLPAMQKAAEADFSPVINITSESPAVTSLDFLADPLPLPPPPDDEGLMKFAEESQSEESAPKRPLGQAELLVEASFADLRHGGDGNLSGAYVYLKKNNSRRKSNDQPFPDSWMATTAPIVAGMLTDIVSEIFLDLGADGRDILFPIIMGQLQHWSVGRPRIHLDSADQKGEETFNDVNSSEPWQPCEALVRVACHEIGRIPQRLVDEFPRIGQHKAVEWTATVSEWIAVTLSKSVIIEQAYQVELVRAKLEVYGLSEESAQESEDSAHASMNGDANVFVVVDTPYGKGRLVGERNDCFESDDGSLFTVTMNIIELDSGATLYSPKPDDTITKEEERQETLEKEESEATEAESDFIPRRRSISRETYFERYVPALKVRCVAAHCLQQSLYTNLDDLVPVARRDVIDCLLRSLNQSRNVSCKAGQDGDVAHAFQEAMFSQWGDGVEEVEEALTNAGRVGGMSQRSGSEMFFLTQEAGATKAIIHMLALLYCGNEGLDWDRVEYAEPVLFERLVDVLKKFLQSEKKDGHLIDRSVWRNTSESGGKIAIYCTSFASVVVNILDLILDLDAQKFAKHKEEVFPLLCALVRVQSDEIRGLVHDVLTKQIAPMIGVSMSA